MSTPLWRQLYNAWEEAVTPGLQEVTASNGFRDVLAAGMKANADVTKEIERMSRQWLHLWNLPAATDVRRLRQQVTSLEREVVGLRLELERHVEPLPKRRGADGPAAAAAATTKTTAATKAPSTKTRSTKKAATKTRSTKNAASKTPSTKTRSTKNAAGNARAAGPTRKGADDIELTTVTSTNGRSAKAQD